MSNKYKIPLIIINLLIISLLIISKSISYYYLAFFSLLITTSILKRNLVIYLYLLFVVVNTLLNPPSSGSIISLINLVLFTYLAWINWTNMSGKTFSLFRDMNLKPTIMLSFFLQLISMGFVFLNNPDIKLIIINGLLWCVSLGYFISSLLFIIRSLRCFSSFFITSIIQAIAFVISALIINQFNILNFIMVVLFMLYITIILIYQKNRYK